MIRLIDVSDSTSVELWPGRKLLVATDEQPLLIALPRGAASAYLRGAACSIAFGSPGRTTVNVTGPKRVITALWNAIVASERPDGKVHLVN